MSNKFATAILIEHSAEWRVIVGPFQSYRYAMEWERAHTLILKEAKIEILPFEGVL